MANVQDAKNSQAYYIGKAAQNNGMSTEYIYGVQYGLMLAEGADNILELSAEGLKNYMAVEAGYYGRY